MVRVRRSSVGEEEGGELVFWFPHAVQESWSGASDSHAERHAAVIFGSSAMLLCLEYEGNVTSKRGIELDKLKTNGL